MNGNPALQRQYRDFVEQMREWLQAERGRASRLARFLGVPRQSVSRWFVTGARRFSNPPPWAALHSNVWFHEQKKLENQLLDQARKPTLSADPVTKLLEESRKMQDRLSTWGETIPASRQLAEVAS